MNSIELSAPNDKRPCFTILTRLSKQEVIARIRSVTRASGEPGTGKEYHFVGAVGERWFSVQPLDEPRQVFAMSRKKHRLLLDGTIDGIVHTRHDGLTEVIVKSDLENEARDHWRIIFVGPMAVLIGGVVLLIVRGIRWEEDAIVLTLGLLYAAARFLLLVVPRINYARKKRDEFAELIGNLLEGINPESVSNTGSKYRFS